MANALRREKQSQIISALAEGAVSAQLNVWRAFTAVQSRDWGAKVVEGCTKLLDEKMDALDSKRIEVDEIWDFIGAKDRNLGHAEGCQYGIGWTFAPMDIEIKIVSRFRVGRRDAETTDDFPGSLLLRLENRIQILSDGLATYVNAVKNAFVTDEIGLAQIVKTYYSPAEGRGPPARYSPNAVVKIGKGRALGWPEVTPIIASYTERQNPTMRRLTRRLGRPTKAFSKTCENFRAAAGLRFACYNFVKTHGTLRITPAMAAGVEPGPSTVENLVEATL